MDPQQALQQHGQSLLAQHPQPHPQNAPPQHPVPHAWPQPGAQHPWPHHPWPQHPQPQPPRPPRRVYRDRGLVHLVPALLGIVCFVVVPLFAFYWSFRIYASDSDTVAGAPFAGASVAIMSASAAVLMSSVVTMLAYASLRWGSTSRVRYLQLAGLVLTAGMAVAGVGLTFYIHDMVTTG
ncbi:hypothetical protein [Janibacter alkaliphilus]|uniref:Uncharacterized protein n=1 Tax=Janibacter alkaliphilus TaxID=1069963 RepID=A0A852X437_9MICO|nr:hypothetical protein [Janibacter alkaliphilus]NYG37816.1 hypothetical protein [Janibacter alkaliphilus]